MAFDLAISLSNPANRRSPRQLARKFVQVFSHLYKKKPIGRVYDNSISLVRLASLRDECSRGTYLRATSHSTTSTL